MHEHRGTSVRGKVAVLETHQSGRKGGSLLRRAIGETSSLSMRGWEGLRGRRETRRKTGGRDGDGKKRCGEKTKGEMKAKTSLGVPEGERTYNYFGTKKKCGT